MNQPIALSPSILSQLREESIIKTFGEGEVILREGAYIKSIPMVMTGSIKVFRSEDSDREILLYYIKAGESCVMSFLGGLHHESSKVKAVVEDDAEIWFIPIERLTYLLSKHPEFMDYFFRLYHKRFEELLAMVNDLSFKKVDERLLDLLHKKQEISHSHIITITHEQLANELGTARVVVSRLLKELEIQGEVKLGRNRIEILKL